MEVMVTDGALGKKILEITVPAEELGKKQAHVLRELQREVKIPGFRPGKVPISIIKSRYPDEVKSQLIRQVIPDFYEQALTETGFEPIGQPQFDFGELAESEPFTFKATVEVLPEIEVDHYSGIEISKTIHQITEKDVEEGLEQIRQDQASLVSVDRPAQEGDFINIELTVLDRTGVQLIGEKSLEATYLLGSKVLGEAFDQALTGATAEQTLDVVSVPGQEYQRRDLVGKETRFRVKIQQITERHLPEPDDEFAKDVNDRFKSLDELRDYIRQTLEEREEERSRSEMRNQIINHLIDRNHFDPPEVMVNRFIDDLLENYKSRHENPEEVDEELFRNEHRATALREIKAYLLLDNIAKKEHLEVSEQEVDQRIKELAERAGMPPAKYRAGLIRSRQFESFRDKMKERKVFDFLMARSKIKEESV